jgi:hypothetical protein
MKLLVESRVGREFAASYFLRSLRRSWDSQAPPGSGMRMEPAIYHALIFHISAFAGVKPSIIPYHSLYSSQDLFVLSLNSHLARYRRITVPPDRTRPFRNLGRLVVIRHHLFNDHHRIRFRRARTPRLVCIRELVDHHPR